MWLLLNPILPIGWMLLIHLLPSEWLLWQASMENCRLLYLLPHDWLLKHLLLVGWLAVRTITACRLVCELLHLYYFLHLFQHSCHSLFLSTCWLLRLLLHISWLLLAH